MPDVFNAVKSVVKKMNENGVPLPMIRANGAATLTGTMAFISFNTCVIGQFGKLARFFDGVDLTQANYLFGICLAAYLGRRFQGNGSTKTVSVEADKPQVGDPQ